jgi:hypothetical protein
MPKRLIILTINSLGEFVNKKITFAQTIGNKNQKTALFLAGSFPE